MTTTTEPDHLADGIATLRQCATGPTTFAMLTHVSARALVRELDERVEEIRAISQRLEHLYGKLSDARRTIRDLTEVNDNLAAEKEQHGDAELVGAVIAARLHAEVAHLEIEVGALHIAVDFYRKMAKDGVRINGATDAAFLTALELDL